MHVRNAITLFLILIVFSSVSASEQLPISMQTDESTLPLYGDRLHSGQKEGEEYHPYSNLKSVPNAKRPHADHESLLPFNPWPSGDHIDPSQAAIRLAAVSPAMVNVPAAIN